MRSRRMNQASNARAVANAYGHAMTARLPLSNYHGGTHTHTHTHSKLERTTDHHSQYSIAAQNHSQLARTARHHPRARLTVCTHHSRRALTPHHPSEYALTPIASNRVRTSQHHSQRALTPHHHPPACDDCSPSITSCIHLRACSFLLWRRRHLFRPVLTKRGE